MGVFVLPFFTVGSWESIEKRRHLKVCRLSLGGVRCSLTLNLLMRSYGGGEAPAPRIPRFVFLSQLFLVDEQTR